MKMCTKCGNPLMPASENFCANCWYLEDQEYTAEEKKAIFVRNDTRYIPPAEEAFNHGCSGRAMPKAGLYKDAKYNG